MIDFLFINGISLKTINELKKDDALLFDLSCNKDNCISILKYFQKIGINCLDELMLNKTYIFFKTFGEVLYAFKNCKEEKIVELINEDISNIDLLDI